MNGCCGDPNNAAGLDTWAAPVRDDSQWPPISWKLTKNEATKHITYRLYAKPIDTRKRAQITPVGALQMNGLSTLLFSVQAKWMGQDSVHDPEFISQMENMFRLLLLKIHAILVVLCVFFALSLGLLHYIRIEFIDSPIRVCGIHKCIWRLPIFNMGSTNAGNNKLCDLYNVYLRTENF